jgi:hypothetical protein
VTSFEKVTVTNCNEIRKASGRKQRKRRKERETTARKNQQQLKRTKK